MLTTLIAAALFAAHPVSDAIRAAEETSVIVKAEVTYTDFRESTKTTQRNSTVCSGFVAYSKGTRQVVVTARHCAESVVRKNESEIVESIDIAPTSVQFFDGDVARVVESKSDPNDDVLILVTSSMRVHPYAFLSTEIPRAEPLFAFGSPNHHSWLYSPATALQGAVYADSMEPDFERTYLIACQSCGPGSSGGPIYNYAGRVVGVVDASDGQYTAIIPSAIIAGFLKEVK